ncbi:hypothetical protein SEMRO_962_G225190.1 [Seminavis robusta]|uniref:DDE Tnp4 domain-containing protein n=1 Tax=Seminavis robusta TaxID=568900 RepID=A0A9N8EGK7_9STRA|nr:hypothetical protein SEMRO_962_G225190.1 [Seminavis robusta]|eukprot:Sro962_g225190.1 n/a (275) ;mRNA; f:33790-34705
MPVDKNVFALLGRNIVGRNDGGFPVEDYRSFFGCSVDVTFEAWCFALGAHVLEDLFKGEGALQAGWYSKQAYLSKVGEIRPPAFDCVLSGADDRGRTCLLSLDGTDYRINEPMDDEEFEYYKDGKRLPFNPKWYTKKFNGPGVRYEIAICIQTGKICWAYGPFPCGKWSDSRIFQHNLQHQLGENEMVEADGGYAGLPFDVRTPNDSLNDDDKRAKGQVRARHEAINRRLKQWGVLGQKFRHELGFHKTCFRAVVMMTQLSILDGEAVTFGVDY